MELLRSHQCSLASPEGCQRAVCVKVDLAHRVCWHSSLCRVTVPDPQPGKEFVFIRGHQCCLEVTEYWGAEHAEGGSLKPSWNVEAGTSCCCQWYSWKADVFNITAQQSILKVESPSIKRGVWSLSSPMRIEAKGFRRLGWLRKQVSAQPAHLLRCGITFSRGGLQAPCSQFASKLVAPSENEATKADWRKCRGKVLFPPG